MLGKKTIQSWFRECAFEDFFFLYSENLRISHYRRLQIAIFSLLVRNELDNYRSHTHTHTHTHSDFSILLGSQTTAPEQASKEQF